MPGCFLYTKRFMIPRVLATLSLSSLYCPFEYFTECLICACLSVKPPVNLVCAIRSERQWNDKTGNTGDRYATVVVRGYYIVSWHRVSLFWLSVVNNSLWAVGSDA